MIRDQDRRTFQVAMCGLWQVFHPTGPELPIETQRAYFNAMQHLGIGLCVLAFHIATKKCKFFPKPVELCEFVMHPEDDPDFIAEQGFNSALQYGVTGRQPVDFEDPLINATIKMMGGLDYFASLGTNEAQRFHKKNFIAIYKRLAKLNNPKGTEPLRCKITRCDEPKKIACDYIKEKKMRITDHLKPVIESELKRIAKNLEIDQTVRRRSRNGEA